MDLERRVLGQTGLEVTTLGFGAMELRGAPNGPDVSDAHAARVLGAVLDGGINLIDTSIDYGRSEEHIGRAIAHRRDEYVLCTKCGCVPGAGMGGPASFLGRSAIIASVVTRRPATEAASCNAVRTTFAGSMTPCW